MAMLLFYVGTNRYAVDSKCIIKIVPQVFLEKMPSAPAYVAGFLNWLGLPIPVIDFSRLIEGRESRHAFHSRIMLLKDSISGRHLGLLGEKVVDILDLSPHQFLTGSFYFSHYPYLAGIYNDDKGIIQRIDVEELFKFVSVELLPAVKEEKNGIS